MTKLLTIILLFLSSSAFSQDYFLFKGRFVTPANQAPVVNVVPPAIAITLPVDSTILTGIATDADGISSLVWTQTAGPSIAVMGTPNLTSTAVNNLVAGVYDFVLSATDSLGAITTSSILQVTVNPAINILPLADAGANLSITLPDSDTTLNGSGSDADGTISSYAWVQLPGGPNTATIGTPSAAVTTVSNLIDGTYWFQLTVTDNSGATAINTASVTVHPIIPPANLSPIANAGPDIIINL